MKDYKKIKKFGAAVTAAAMFGTLGTGVFAAEEAVAPEEVPSVPAVEEPAATLAPAETDAPVVDEAPAETDAPVVDEAPVETDAPAKDEAPAEEEDVDLAAEKPFWDNTNLNKDTGVQVSKATASVKDGIYTVNLAYEVTGADSNAQVTMLAYLFDNATGAAYAGTADVPAMEDGKIRAIDQTANSGNISFKLALEGGLTVTADSTLVVKMGSDAESATTAQAIIIDLAGAEEGPVVPDVVYGDVDDSGKVNAMDHALLGRYLAKWDVTLKRMDAADLDSSGKVNAMDHAILGRHLAKWEGYETLPKQ